MPFKSEKQRRYLWANEPEIARDWTDTYGSGIHKALGGRIGLWTGGFPDFFPYGQETYTTNEDLGIPYIYLPNDSWRSQNFPNVYTDRTYRNQPNYMGENYPMQLENVNPSLIDRGKEVIGTGKDAIQNAINYGLGAISGIPFVGSAIDFIGDQFEYRPAEIYTDEEGRVYNPEALDRMNARGGWYTDAARSSRRDKSIDWMEKRKAAGKRFSEKNLARLQEQQRQEEAARVTATRAIAAQNAQTYGTDDATGGYQSSWGGNQDFMSGSGTAADMGSFADGGLASLWQR